MNQETKNYQEVIHALIWNFNKNNEFSSNENRNFHANLLIGYLLTVDIEDPELSIAPKLLKQYRESLKQTTNE